ncbi:SDR family NAD(P)-dependent oxidoreductase [Cognatishimia activa]|uniref:SDR family NAD(P)-dependent oxidoreductase n=1 Tax=Cognatishimia activa TaxID=1715691 RepID=UPI002230CA0A|nr:SDR family NAD(P)-dependent oxidoreductase [Cognatishimia activa]UZD90342.1 SDR family NAD(P)-dependent oxidoreductase [Cognatishimia activa]
MRRATPITDPEHVVITGATSGLGRALAIGYARPGRMLSLAGRNAERLEEVATACERAGANVHTATLDVTDAAAMEAWLARCYDALPIDILVANAGLGGAAALAPPSGEDGEQARNILSVNTVGVVNTVTPATPKMVARGRGQIVIVGSIQDSLGVPQSPVYCASKAAVQIYGDGLRRLLSEKGVGVTVVRPGFIDTPMSQSLAMPRPFCWTPERAAEKVMAGVGKGAAQITFPWPLRLVLGLQKFAPVWLIDFVVARSMRIGWAPPGSPDADGTD